MAVEVVTVEDLELFRMRLLDDLDKLLAKMQSKPAKPWLKRAEVRKLFGISEGTLQSLRVSGRLKSNKLGGRHYYRWEDIEGMMGVSKTAHVRTMPKSIG